MQAERGCDRKLSGRGWTSADDVGGLFLWAGWSASGDSVLELTGKELVERGGFLPFENSFPRRLLH